MTYYAADRSFTDYVHQKLALPVIYQSLAWEQVNLSREKAQALDFHKGIDYVFRDQKSDFQTVQERFRESRYRNYGDFTIRYRRDGNFHPSRRSSEFYKMKATYFVYGIVNGEKSVPDSCTDFIKYAVINQKKVYEKISHGEILIRDNKAYKCTLENGKIICPVKYNRDQSSSFFPIEIAFLQKLWGEEVILMQKGFI